jgi:DUF4097 and DUF4098 domain-containing protein YvlB
MYALLALLPVSFAATPVDKSLDAATNATVSLSNVCGALSVAGWDQPRIQVTGELEEADDEVVLTGTVARIRLEVRDTRGGDEGCATLLVRLPDSVRLEAETVSADLDVAGLTGTLDLDTVSGDLRVQGAPREVQLETVSGEVLVAAATPSLSVETVSGNVAVHRALGRVEAETVSGEVAVEGGPFGRVELTTVSGDVVLVGPVELSGRAEVSTHSGDVTLRLPNGLPASYALSTFSGVIRGTPGEIRQGSPGRSLAFVEGAGTATIAVVTHSGDINIEAQ